MTASTDDAGDRALAGARTILSQTRLRDQFTAIAARRDCSRGQRPSIVVVGEVSSGKSTLVNALLNRPDLSPTGDGETTGTYLRFTTPTDELPAGSARVLFLAGGSAAIDATDLPRWVLADSPELVAEDGRMSLGAIVAAESPSLPGVDIIDTPGTGGLSPAHARVAIKSAEQASVLLLVTDASGRLSRPALDLLADCAPHVDTIAVAVSRIDLVGGTWAAVAEENRAILVAEDPAYADIPIVGVSALAALQALDRPDEVRRARRRAASRMDHLVLALKERLERARSIPTIRALSGADDLLESIEITLGQQHSNQLAGDEEIERTVRSDTERLRELEAKQRTWRPLLNRDLRRLRQGVSTEINDRVNALTRGAREELARQRLGVSRARMHAFMLNLNASATLILDDVSGLIHERVTTVVRHTFVSHGLSDISAQIIVDESWLQRPGDTDMPSPVGAGAQIDPQLMMTGMAGLWAGAWAAGAGAIAIAAPVGIVVGAGLITANLVSRGAMARRQELTGVIREVGQRVSGTLHRLFDAYTIEFQPEIEIAFERELSRITRELEHELSRLRKARQLSAEKRKDTRGEIEHRLGLVRQQRAAVRRAIGQFAESGTSGLSGPSDPHSSNMADLT